ncbi:MFS transporter [Streptomyces sp. NPDC006012]|uniref:MFS transporter n=1 Tax=Streptomyces sp. NPDC006012 TaxID=3364739 RepID=UPI0036BFA2FC
MPGGTRAPGARGGPAASYRQVLASPGAPGLALASLVSKWPISMFPVSTVLLVSPRYSYAQAGAAVGTMLLANALTSPHRGGLIARQGARAVLGTCLAGYVLGLVGLGLSAAAHLPFPVVLTAALVMGTFFPPASIMLRSHWTALDRARGHGSANALESAIMDVALITGPVLATWLSTTVGAVLPLAAIAVLMSVAVVLLTRFSGGDRTPPAGARPRTAVPPARLHSRSLWALFGAQFLFCAALAGTEVTLPIYAQQHAVPGESGWYLAGLSVGSITGALLAGRSGASARIRLPTVLGAFAVGSCALGLAMVTTPGAVLAACPVAGLAVGSVFAQLFTTLGDLTPPDRDHEVQGWANAMTTIGFAAGSFGGAALTGAFGAPVLLLWSPPAALLAALMTAAVLPRKAGTSP